MKCNKTIGKFLLTVATLGVAAILHSTPASAGTVELPTVQGHIQTGGSFVYTREDSSNSNFEVDPMLEFFILDRISIGAVAGLDWAKVNGEGSFTHTISPAITWYFLDLNPMELFVHQQANFGVASISSHPTSWTTGLGVSMFFAKNVAFAPEIEWHYGDQLKGYWDIAGAFQIFF